MYFKSPSTYIKLIISLIFVIFINSCGSNAPKGFYETEKSFLHNLFLTKYLWFESVPDVVDYTQYKTSNEMIDALKDAKDSWSFMMTEKQYDDYANQVTQGFGFGYTEDFHIYFVRINAPAYGKLKRGDKILKIDDKNVTSYTQIKVASSNLDMNTTFTLHRDNKEIEVVVTPSVYSFKVTLGKVITLVDNKKVGYLRYDSFSSNSIDEFEKEFTKFKEANVSELIIDLRYNGGGSIAVASMLLDNITNQHSGKKQVYLDWNSKYKNLNENYYFSGKELQDGNELDMNRVIFLTTNGSASASELVISALQPYLEEVVVIGENTHGKNVGMSGATYENNFYFLINFYVKNSNDETTPPSGIVPTCKAEDNTTYPMDDKRDSLLKSAIYYIENGECK